jgi:hypothetical protein
MNKVLSIALAAAIVALPLPASQLLAAGASPAPASVEAEIVASDPDFSLLLADPFLIDALSYQNPVSFLDLSKV